MNLKFRSKLLTTFVLLIGAMASAQPGFDPDVDDVAPLPGILVLALVALGIGIFRSKTD